MPNELLRLGDKIVKPIALAITPFVCPKEQQRLSNGLPYCLNAYLSSGGYCYPGSHQPS
ncbi:MAG: hypothetical protein IT324_11495 [Anaerolineae bacterium]|nr:hypothetical protein [Anaerolineae bacterium]